MFHYFKTCKMGVDLDKYKEFQIESTEPTTKPMNVFMQLLTGVNKPTIIPGVIRVWFRGVSRDVRDIGIKFDPDTIDDYNDTMKAVEEELSVAFAEKEKEQARILELARIYHEEAKKKHREALEKESRKPAMEPPGLPKLVDEAIANKIMGSFPSSGTFMTNVDTMVSMEGKDYSMPRPIDMERIPMMHPINDLHARANRLLS